MPERADEGVAAEFPLSLSPEGREDVLKNLYQQTLWLEQNLELHILANHYFENLKALFFAGVFFQGDDPKRWLSFSIKELQKEKILEM